MPISATHRAAGAALAGALILAPALAWADACADVTAAFTRLAEAPAYSQTTVLKDKGEIRAVVLGGSLYVLNGGTWTTIPLTPEQRAKTVQSIVGAPGAVSECTALPDEAIDGVPTKAFAYRMPAVPDLGGGMQKLWVRADGLPRRLVGNSGAYEVNFAYENIVAPIP